MPKMKNVLTEKNYIAIADWMMDLDLNTRELLTYAIIYSFSQKQDSCYFGSFEYLASWLGIESSQNVSRYLKPLVEKQLVVKKEIRTKKNQKACLYRTSISRGMVINNPDIDYIIIQPWMLQQLHLNGKDLLLYALIHGYSRKDSGNICRYQKEYFARWMSCRKDNVSRQIKKALDANLIIEVNPGEFRAVVPDDIKILPSDDYGDGFENVDLFGIDNEFPQSESTPSGRLPQTESTLPHCESGLPQTESTSSLKVRGNNLTTYNLEDNLDFTDNNKGFSAHDSEESLSVVVNEDIPVEDFIIDQEKEVFEQKKRRDFELYSRFKKKNPLVQFIMKGFAKYCFRVMLARWPGISIVDKAQELLLDTVCCPRFKGRQRDIIDLGEKKISELFHIALDLNDPESDLTISKSKKAYLIGVIETMLEEK